MAGKREGGKGRGQISINNQKGTYSPLREGTIFQHRKSLRKTPGGGKEAYMWGKSFMAKVKR